MKTALYQVFDNDWIEDPKSEKIAGDHADLVLCFASKTNLLEKEIYQRFKTKFPKAEIAMTSTAGEICQEKVLDNSIVAVAMQFEKTDIQSTDVNIKDYKNTYEAAISLGKKIPKNDLRYILIFSDGSLVNGSELVKGLTTQVDKETLITGGLAGDDANFNSTLVGLNKQPKQGEIVAIGFYGNHITVTHGSQGGWDIFGLQKRITNSSSNVLLELEDQNALELYKKYLGEEAKKLPGSALLFPLAVTIPGASEPIVRTILSINEEDKSMTFAGDVPVGSEVRFMKANFDNIIQAASGAADQTISNGNRKPDFALLISCVGRKLILESEIEKEIESVSKSFNHKTILGGFYSYGEISPLVTGGKCQLHNQTMTITSFYED